MSQPSEWGHEAKEQEFLDNHNREHTECALEHWQEQDCSICEERVDGEIEAGIRCHHGELVPNVKDERGEIRTDLECPKCEIELDKSIERDISFQKHGL